jgi:hypothetical protein
MNKPQNQHCAPDEGMGNCLRTRRMLAIDPSSMDDAVRTHVAHCEVCGRHAGSLLGHESALRAAAAVPLPANLVESILQRTLAQEETPAPARPWSLDRLRQLLAAWSTPRPMFAGAAALLLIAGCWFIVPMEQGRKTDWNEVVLAHVIHEGGALTQTDVQPEDTLDAALRQYGLAVKGRLGVVRYVDHCEMPGGAGLHAVIDTPDLGKVSLVLLPPGSRAEGRQLQGDGFAAQLLRINRANVGIVTQRPDRLGALVSRLRAQLVASS